MVDNKREREKACQMSTEQSMSKPLSDRITVVNLLYFNSLKESHYMSASMPWVWSCVYSECYYARDQAEQRGMYTTKYIVGHC